MPPATAVVSGQEGRFPIARREGRFLVAPSSSALSCDLAAGNRTGGTAVPPDSPDWRLETASPCRRLETAAPVAARNRLSCRRLEIVAPLAVGNRRSIGDWKSSLHWRLEIAAPIAERGKRRTRWRPSAPRGSPCRTPWRSVSPGPGPPAWKPARDRRRIRSGRPRRAARGRTRRSPEPGRLRTQGNRLARFSGLGQLQDVRTVALDGGVADHALGFGGQTRRKAWLLDGMAEGAPQTGGRMDLVAEGDGLRLRRLVLRAGRPGQDAQDQSQGRGSQAPPPGTRLKPARRPRIHRPNWKRPGRPRRQ